MYAVAMDNWKSFNTTHSSGNSILMQVHLPGWVKLYRSLFLSFDVFTKIDFSEATFYNFLLNFEFSKEYNYFICFIYLDLLLI